MPFADEAVAELDRTHLPVGKKPIPKNLGDIREDVRVVQRTLSSMSLIHRFSALGKLALACVVSAVAFPPARACTIVLLTDGNDVLFCNNEDW
ncbi:MAG: hypothetical protein JNL97_02925, partial [Verrucomicrobiales bacterium]|nr:hypothetical protein [Verrucomicrobiales bacterium]